ncbi:MAG TPA: helix-turn-helix transcriptional regulator [bacterium]|nr:helix-turn-helix transcriptional regulator [bacterium]HQL62438.1 helix-turn-helix transcriptional regulator [bacterium]
MPRIQYDPVPHDHKAFLEKASKRKGFQEAYNALEDEYALAREMLSARSRAGLTQEAVAHRMGTTKSAVSRLEGANRHAPSLASLKKYAEAVGCTLKIRLEPQQTTRRASPQPAARTSCMRKPPDGQLEGLTLG